MTRGLATFVRDNLEAFAVAIAMALVIRHYCIEAFRIPTRSMMPTLLGDEPTIRQHGDRILVDKYVYLRRDPERYEVVVFQFPLNRLRNYIKRLVGLPGEWLQIVDGDVWTSRDRGATWEIQRKPAGARDELFFPYYPEPVGDPDAFAGGGNWEADGDWLVAERDGRFKVKNDGTRPATLRFERRLLAYPDTDARGSPDLPWVGDARVRFDLAVEYAGDLVVRLQEHGRAHRLVLGQKKSYAVVVTRAKEHRFDVDVTLRDGMNLSVSFANVDDTLVLEIDGDERFSAGWPFPDPPSEPEAPPEPDLGVPEFDVGNETPWWDHEIALVADGLQATIEDLGIDRDVYYNAGAGEREERVRPHVWKIPAGHFLMLGDNTQSSSDSRKWRVVEVELEDGTTVRYQPPEHFNGSTDNPHYSDLRDGDEDEEVLVRVDVDGLVRRFRRGDVASVEPGPYPFVPRSHLVGRAFAIFWPIHIPRVYGGPTRINLIR